MIRKYLISNPSTDNSRSRKVYTDDILYGIEFEMKFRDVEECDRMFNGARNIKNGIFSIEFDRDVAGFIKEYDGYGDYKVFENGDSILRGFEIVMKPCDLNTLKDYNNIFKEIFLRYKCYPHITSCHVHISAHWMDELFIKLLYQRLYHIQKYVVNKYQPIFYNTFEGKYRKQRRRHAIGNLKEMPDSVLKDKRKGAFFDFLFNGDDPYSITKYNPSRYAWVNFVSLFLYGTLEVRLPETIDQAIDIANYMIGIFTDINLKLERDNNFNHRKLDTVVSDYFKFYQEEHTNEEDEETDENEYEDEEESDDRIGLLLGQPSVEDGETLTIPNTDWIVGDLLNPNNNIADDDNRRRLINEISNFLSISELAINNLESLNRIAMVTNSLDTNDDTVSIDDISM